MEGQSPVGGFANTVGDSRFNSVRLCRGLASRTNGKAHREVQAVRERAAEEVRDALARLQDALSEVERPEGLSVADAEKIHSLTAQASERDAQLQKLERQAERTETLVFVPNGS